MDGAAGEVRDVVNPQGAWVVNGFGISPAGGIQQTVERTASKRPGKDCRYVLDVLLCD